MRHHDSLGYSTSNALYGDDARWYLLLTVLVEGCGATNSEWTADLLLP
jgi:hypothetical protein